MNQKAEVYRLIKKVVATENYPREITNERWVQKERAEFRILKPTIYTSIAGAAFGTFIFYANLDFENFWCAIPIATSLGAVAPFLFKQLSLLCADEKPVAVPNIKPAVRQIRDEYHARVKAWREFAEVDRLSPEIALRVIKRQLEKLRQRELELQKKYDDVGVSIHEYYSSVIKEPVMPVTVLDVNTTVSKESKTLNYFKDENKTALASSGPSEADFHTKNYFHWLEGQWLIDRERRFLLRKAIKISDGMRPSSDSLKAERDLCALLISHTP